MTRRIDTVLPPPTLSQRVRAMSDGQLVGAAAGLAPRADAGSVAALAAVSAELQRRGICL